MEKFYKVARIRARETVCQARTEKDQRLKTSDFMELPARFKLETMQILFLL